VDKNAPAHIINSSKYKYQRLAFTIKIPRTNEYVWCHPHELALKKTLKVLERNARRPNIFNRQTWQEF
jgi:hypothetical protein